MKKTRFLTLLLTLLLVFAVSMAVSASADTDGENAVSLENGSGSLIMPDIEEASAAETAPPKQSGNAPLFIGAGFAVLMFIGVALYCRTKGNKTY